MREKLRRWRARRAFRLIKDELHYAIACHYAVGIRNDVLSRIDPSALLAATDEAEEA